MVIRVGVLLEGLDKGSFAGMRLTQEEEIVCSWCVCSHRSASTTSIFSAVAIFSGDGILKYMRLQKIFK
jgi:hypothetical protein